MNKRREPHAAVFASLAREFVLPFLAVTFRSASESPVAAGLNHISAISECGRLLSFGALSQSDMSDVGPVVAVAAGDYHACAVTASGDLVCSGSNKGGQCDVPPDLGPVVVVAAGAYHTCALVIVG